MRRYICLLVGALMLAACSTAAPPCPPPVTGDVVYIVEQGWHVDIGIPVQQLGPNLAFYRKVFAGARIIMFGYGKKTFFTAPPETISEYFLGPFPGTAAIQVVGLSVLPSDAYPPEDVITLSLPSGGSKALSTYIWDDLDKDATGKPHTVAHSTNPDGLFYQAASEYNLLHTCNTWIAEALENTSLPISSDNVVFSGQVMSQIEDITQPQCKRY